MSRLLRFLILGALGLAFVVVVVGAYVRLSDAGLGCPDWPLCYGQPLPGDIADGDVLAKAWKEMGHRYLAGTLGLFILVLSLCSWKTRQSPGLAAALLALLLFQATLGAWTVTMLLKPAIVTAHLLGGMAILALLALLAARQFPFQLKAPRLRVPAAVALAIARSSWGLSWMTTDSLGTKRTPMTVCLRPSSAMRAYMAAPPSSANFALSSLAPMSAARPPDAPTRSAASKAVAAARIRISQPRGLPTARKRRRRLKRR